MLGSDFRLWSQFRCYQNWWYDVVKESRSPANHRWVATVLWLRLAINISDWEVLRSLLAEESEGPEIDNLAETLKSVVVISRTPIYTGGSSYGNMYRDRPQNSRGYSQRSDGRVCFSREPSGGLDSLGSKRRSYHLVRKAGKKRAWVKLVKDNEDNPNDVCQAP